MSPQEAKTKVNNLLLDKDNIRYPSQPSKGEVTNRISVLDEHFTEMSHRAPRAGYLIDDLISCGHSFSFMLDSKNMPELFINIKKALRLVFNAAKISFLIVDPMLV